VNPRRKSPVGKFRTSNPVETLFDPHRALALARQFAFPRQSGSDGNERAVERIVEILEAAQIRFKVDSFKLSRIPTLALRIILLGEVFLQFLRLLYSSHSWPLVLLLIYPAFLLTVPGWVRASSTSLLAEILDRNVITEPIGEGQNHVLLVAHHDTKSQPLPVVRRILAFCGLGVCHLIGLLPLVTIPEPGFDILSFMAASCAAVLSLLLIFQSYGNRSPGALDNWSGVGVLLAVAEKLKESPLPDWRVSFLFSGAEEMGLQGATHFVREEFTGREQVINIDTKGRVNDYGSTVVGARRSRTFGTVLVSAGYPFSQRGCPLGF
jgi:hypothetical protein